MDRREMLSASTMSLISLAFPNLIKKPEPKFWNREQLLKLFSRLDRSRGTLRETLDMTDPKHWNGEGCPPHEVIYLSICRMFNYLYRRTLDGQSKQWLVMSPEMTRSELWSFYQFGVYSTPGYPGGTWTQKPWQHFIQEQVSTGVFDVGMIGGMRKIYVCPGFPNNKILIGMGYKEVVHFRQEGMKQYDWGEYPNYVPYMDKPTIKNYAVITLDYSRTSPSNF